MTALWLRPLTGWDAEKNCWLHPASEPVYLFECRPKDRVVVAKPSRVLGTVIYQMMDAHMVGKNAVIQFNFPTGERFGMTSEPPDGMEEP